MGVEQGNRRKYSIEVICVKSDGIIVVESLEEEIWPERMASFTKYKEKTYGITRISYYQKEENEK